MADENIYEKIDEENLYEKPCDEPDVSAEEEQNYENQSTFAGDAPVTDAIYSGIDVQGKAGRSLTEVQNGVGLYEVPAEENDEVSSRRSSTSSSAERFGEPCDAEQPEETTYEDNAEDGMMMAYSLPKGRLAEPQEETVDYNLKSVQNNNVEEEEKPVDPTQPEIALFVKVWPKHYTLSLI